MSQVLLFHHALGLTDGCRSFAARLQAAGHKVHTPDLYEGNVFSDLSAGVAHAEQIGFDTVIERGCAVAESLPTELVYVGLSLGVLPAQMLAQTRATARGAVFISGAVPPSEFGGAWPQGVPLQIHMMDADTLVVEDGDLDVGRQLADTDEGAQLYLYRGDQHLFIDSGLPDYDQTATELVTRRITAFLDSVS